MIANRHDLGQLPVVAGMLIIGRRFEKMTTDELRQHLHSDGCTGPNLVLLEMRRRGENIDAELPLLHELLVSEDVQRRTRGWAALRSAFPERAAQMSEYNPMASPEECRRHARTLGDA